MVHLFSFALSTVLFAATARPPNVVFFLIDDFGHTDIGYHNRLYDNLIATPNLDALAGDGIKLESYYVQPICTPTRSQLLSGRYQIHTGLQHGVINPAQPYGLSTSIPVLPNFLVPLGYKCHKVGKWHLGFYNNASCPWNRGFDVAHGGSDFGYLGGMEDYWTHVKEDGYDFRDNGVPDRSVASVEPSKNNPGNPLLYSTHLFRERGINITRHHAAHAADAPLFLYMPFQAVHAPLEATPRWLSKVNLTAFKNNVARMTLAAMVMEMDEAVGAVVQAFRDTGLYNNTIFILSTDNGGILPGGFNWPLRGQKHTLWEGGMRGVGFIHSPLLPRRGFVYNGLVHVSDWLPTIVALAGGHIAANASLDGHDVWAAVTANASSPRTELLHNIEEKSAAIRVGDLKLMLHVKPMNHFVPPGCPRHVCAQPSPPPSSRCSSINADVQLFNISEDPLELCNLAESQPADVARLRERLAFYNASAVPSIGRNCPKDPAADPALHTGVEHGCWGPWTPSFNCTGTTPPVPPAPTPSPNPPAPQPTQHCYNIGYGGCHERNGSLADVEAASWESCCAACEKFKGCAKWGFRNGTQGGQGKCQLHRSSAECRNKPYSDTLHGNSAYVYY